MRPLSPFSVLFLAVICVSLAGCGTENPFQRGPEVLVDDDTAIPPAAGEVSFSDDVAPLLSSCISCHRGGTGGWTYTGGDNAYAETIAIVDIQDAENSQVLVKGAGGQSHGGGTLFGQNSSQYQTILLWIEAGAPDN